MYTNVKAGVPHMDAFDMQSVIHVFFVRLW